MARVVGVRFKTAGKVYYFDPGELELRPGDGAVVETARGTELGTVIGSPREVPEEEVKTPLKKVLRKAGPEDLARQEENEEKARQAFTIGQQKIAAHGLPMKLAHVEYTLDGSKIIFYFTAENRVDFRELVKDLASTFRTRIELRQIGVRDQAKLLGGLGTCGRQLCCQAFLGDFAPVSIRSAKEQNLSLNPTKISGICGRLMCCLNFESETYREAKKAAKEGETAREVEVVQDEGVREGELLAMPAETAVPAAMAEVEPPAPAPGTPAASSGQRTKGRRRRHRRQAGAGQPAGGGQPAQAPAKQEEPRPAGAPASQAERRASHRRRRRPKGSGRSSPNQGDYPAE